MKMLSRVQVLPMYPHEQEYVFKGTVEGKPYMAYVIAATLEQARTLLMHQHHRDMECARCLGRYAPDGTFERIDS